MLNDLLRYKNNQKYLVFDFETEGLNLFYSKPFQLSFVVAEGKRVIENHDYYLDWKDLNVSEEAARVTNFSYLKYNNLKKNPNECLHVFEKYLYNPEYIIIGHNIIGFDIYIHKTLRRLCGKSPDFSYLNNLIDTNCLSKAIKCNIVKSKNDSMIQWMFRLNDFHKKGVKTNHKQMLKDNNIPFDESKLHNSLYDVQKNFELFQKLIWQIEI